MIFILIIRIWICIGITHKITKIINSAARLPLRNLISTMSTSIVPDKGFQAGIYPDNLNKLQPTPSTSANIHAQALPIAPTTPSTGMHTWMRLLTPRENLQNKLSQGTPATKTPLLQGTLKMPVAIGMTFSKTAPKPLRSCTKGRAVTLTTHINRLIVIMFQNMLMWRHQAIAKQSTWAPFGQIIWNYRPTRAHSKMRSSKSWTTLKSSSNLWILLKAAVQSLT